VHVPVPDVAVWISVPIHLLGGLALLVGFYTRWAAALLSLVCLGTAFGVHLPIGDQDNMIHFYKNLVMTGTSSAEKSSERELIVRLHATNEDVPNTLFDPLGVGCAEPQHGEK
jgi:hypothetical protein